MPPKKPKAVLLQYNQNDMEEAVKAVREGVMSKKLAAKTFNVPRTSLIRKVNGEVPLEKKMGAPTVLTKAEEDLLETFILACCRKGFPVHRDNICDSVEKILQKAGRGNVFPNGRPGTTWFKAFLKRHPKLTVKEAEFLTKSRARVSEEGVRKWFSEVLEYLKEEKCEKILENEERVYNGDETGFRLCPKTGKVICEKGERHTYMQVSNNEKEQLTVMCTFSASGKTVPPMIVYPYKRLPRTIAESVPDKWGIGLSTSGWMNSEIFYEYIANCFIPYLTDNKVTMPVILFVDGYRSHVTLEVSDLCSQNKIILVALHPNSTHFLQPADVSVFGPLKKSWRETIRRWKYENPMKDVTRETFASLLEDSLKKVSDETIKAGFKACGIWPFDPNAINYNKIIATRQVTDPTAQTTEPSTTNNNIPPQQVNRDVRIEDSSKTLTYMEKFIDEERLVMFKRVFDSRDEWWEQYPNELAAKELYEVWRAIKIDVSSTKEETAVQQNKPLPENQAPIIIEIPNVPYPLNDPMNVDQDPFEIELYDDDELRTEIEVFSKNFLVDSNLPPKEETVHEQEMLTLESPTTDFVPIASCSRELGINFRENVVESSPTSLQGSKTKRYRPQHSILSPFKTCLVYPKTPPKSNQGKSKRKLFPSVVSSEKWKKHFQIKEDEKNKKEMKKGKRRKNNKEDDWICKECHASWYNENNEKLGLKWVNCDTCKCAFHFRCLPRNHKENYGLESDSEDDCLAFICHYCTKDDLDDSDF